MREQQRFPQEHDLGRGGAQERHSVDGPALARGGPLTPAAVVALQRAVGNHAVAEVLSATASPQVQRARSQRQRRVAGGQWGRRSRYNRVLIPTQILPLTVVALGNRLRASYTRHHGQGAPGAQGGHFVYIATVAGRASYVGITNDFIARQAEHGDRFHLHVLNRGHPLTRIEVRGIEQFGINAGASQNIAQSISRRHPYYADALAFGRAFYRWAVRTYGANVRFRR